MRTDNNTTHLTSNQLLPLLLKLQLVHVMVCPLQMDAGHRAQRISYTDLWLHLKVGVQFLKFSLRKTDRVIAAGSVDI